MPHAVDLARLSTHQLLRLYADILTELIRRKVIRSRNAPAGDLAERLVAQAYNGTLTPPSAKSWDVLADGRRLQVKTRLISSGDSKSHNYSPFRSWDFAACVFLILDAYTYDVVSAVELPVEVVKKLARETRHVNGFLMGTRTLLGLPGAVDRTADVAKALDELDMPAE